MPHQTKVEKTLTELQRLIRRHPSGSAAAAMTRLLPLDVTSGEETYLHPLRDEVAAMKAVQEALLADLHFEHLRKPDDDVWHFVSQCWANPEANKVADFIEEHQQDPFEAVCYIPVEHLSVETAKTVLGIRLLTTNDPALPQARPGINLEKPTGCVAAVSVEGTNYGLMASRARIRASHVLRVMRIALREHLGIHDRQLRFHLGMTYAFDDDRSGWDTRDDAAYELGFGGDLVTLAENQPVSNMPAYPSTDIEKKADIALRWMERAWLAGDPLVALLYLFFALEALPGNKSEGLKAHGLAFRQTMLSHIVDGNFSHPSVTWFLYDRVRSGAVHSEAVPDVDEKTVRSFAWDVRRTLNQYLTLAQSERFARRGHLLTFLECHEDRQQLTDWLHQNGGDVWTLYLDKP